MPDLPPRELIEKYAALPVPRYTSYPTAPHFSTDVTANHYAEWLRTVPGDTGVSLYLHIPYCDRLCWFCGCHTKQTLRYEPVAAYLARLEREIDLVAAALGTRRPVTAIHFGGGSPTMLHPDDLKRLMGRLRRAFAVAPDAEISVEIDPNDITEEKLDALAAIGLTRASLGVQDFDPAVQAAINRPQSFADTKGVVDGVRQRGVGSVNLDVLYGLPLQTEAKLLATIAQVISLRPDRIALFGYAHVPWMKKHQTMIPDETLPGTHARFAQAEAAAEALALAGYERVGIDHFALPHDSLAIAARTGTLRRNFQGYTTDDCETLIGLGASAVSRLPQGYVQNITATHEYERQVDAGALPVARGFCLTEPDLIRAHVIEQLMCRFGFDYADLEGRFGAAAVPVLRDAKLIAAMDTDGFVAASKAGFAITDAGRPFARTIAAGFDTYLSLRKARHSVAV